MILHYLQQWIPKGWLEWWPLVLACIPLAKAWALISLARQRRDGNLDQEIRALENKRNTKMWAKVAKEAAANRKKREYP